MIDRTLLIPYLLVGGGLLAGLFVGVFVIETQPAILGWIFGAGAGISFGAFIAAISSGEPLAGSGMSPPDDDWDVEDNESDGLPEDAP